VRLADEVQFSVYNFEAADVAKAWKHFELYEAECNALIEKYGVLNKDFTLSRQIGHSTGEGYAREMKRFPLLAAYDFCLKCSHLFNILDARGAISVTERVSVIARVRVLAVGIARLWVDQQKSDQPESDAPGDKEGDAAASEKKAKVRKENLSPVG
jgi:glycyl-tRNA synthetase alpha chain